MNSDSPLFRFQMWRRSLPRALRLLLTVNVALYVLMLVLRFVPAGYQLLVDHLALNAVVPGVFLQPWQLVTYSVTSLDGSFWGFINFLFSMLWLYWMGREYEEFYGSHRLFGLYVLSALGGALVAVAVAALGVPGVYAGAFGPALAVLCTVATLHPNRGMGLFLLGVVPLKWIAIGFTALFVIFNPDPTVVGAALVGYLFGKAQAGGTDLAAWAVPLFADRAPSRRAPKSAGRPRAQAASPGDADGGMLSRMERWLAQKQKQAEPPSSSDRPTGKSRRTPKDAPPTPGTADDGEIDRILDKISEVGYDGLTAEEKKTLLEASRR
jgi:membrane associated rhomboid family serine protease